MARVLLFIAIFAGAAAVVYQGWDLVALGASHPMLKGNDDSQYYFWLRSLVIDGDWDFANDLRETPTLSPEAKQELAALPRTPAGRQPDKYPIGWALASLPFFLAAHGLCLLGHGPADGWQPVYQYGLWLGHLGLTVLGLFVTQRLLRRFLPARSADIGLLAGWLASPLIYYQTARISMAHGLAFVLTALSHELALCLRDRPARYRLWGLLGLVSSLLVVTRPTSAVYLLFPLGVLASVSLAEWREDRPPVAGWIWFVGAALPACGLQLLAWHQVYGSWWPDTYAGEDFYFFHPELLAVLFSSRHGWFYWHPLLLPGFLAFAWCVYRRRLPASWLVSALLIIYINASWWCWWFGSSFGNRAFEGATLYCMAGLGYLWEIARHPIARKCVATVLAIAVAANLLWLTSFMTDNITRGESVSYADFIRATLRFLAPKGQ